MIEYGKDLAHTGLLYQHKETGNRMHLVSLSGGIGVFKLIEPTEYQMQSTPRKQWKAVCRMENMELVQ